MGEIQSCDNVVFPRPGMGTVGLEPSAWLHCGWCCEARVLEIVKTPRMARSLRVALGLQNRGGKKSKRKEKRRTKKATCTEHGGICNASRPSIRLTRSQLQSKVRATGPSMSRDGPRKKTTSVHANRVDLPRHEGIQNVPLSPTMHGGRLSSGRLSSGRHRAGPRVEGRPPGADGWICRPSAAPR
ncbi:hypothetical protein VTK73DRAFT_2074 [Phialemonium thermophilum]|uniref:Uncharacterized protein n=1 Tax=Phialemonium thermophilum TaxID=223376 RepID=A0ABR3VSK5_9PEZI